MNREIKFRFWGKALKPPQFIDLSNWRIYTNTGEEVLNGSFGLFNNSLIIPQQYTGLKDKNDKEIYEGDIIENGSGRRFIVEWTCLSFEFREVEKTNDGKFYLDRIVSNVGDISKCCRIIGNIFENPEFFK